MPVNKLKQSFDKARLASERRNIVLGVIGRTPTDTPAECRVTARPAFLYVRITTGGNQSLAIARNPGIVSVRANTPVKMVRENGQLVITGYDLSSAAWETATGGDVINQYGVPPHTHKIGSGLEYEVESLRLEPGRVHADSHDMIATVNGFRHWQGTFETDTVDLTSYVPSATNHRWVLVGVDPATNLISVGTSTPVDVGTPLDITDIDAISFAGKIPLGAFQVRYDDTELSQYAYEAREWLNLAASFNDAEGDPANVTTASPADGTSTYAARRDHVHGIANDAVTTSQIVNAAVTNAKLANMAEGTVKARVSTGTGVPEDVTLSDFADAISPELSITEALDDLTDVTLSFAGDGDVLSLESSVWSNYTLKTITQNHPTNLTAYYLDVPLKDDGFAANTSSRCDAGTGAGTYPSGWTEDTAANLTILNDPVGFWHLTNAQGDPDFQYTKDTGIAIDGLGAGESNSFWFGPIHIRDAVYLNDVDFKFVLHAEDTGAPDNDVYVGVQIHWDKDDLKWSIWGIANNGGGEVTGTVFDLARVPLQPLIVRINPLNNTFSTFTCYIGNTPSACVHMPIYTANLGATWNEVFMRISATRGTFNFDTQDSTILIGGIDYSDDD